MTQTRISIEQRLFEAAKRYKQAVYAAGGKISLEDALAEVDAAHARTGKRLPGGKPARRKEKGR